jgi:hypothetical protein
MASCDFLLPRQMQALTQRFPQPDSPYSAKTYQRHSRCWRRASLADLVEQRGTTDKVWVAPERHEARRLWWSLRALCRDTAWSAQRGSERGRALAGCGDVDRARVVPNLQSLVSVACERGGRGDAGQRAIVRASEQAAQCREPCARSAATLVHGGWAGASAELLTASRLWPHPTAISRIQYSHGSSPCCCCLRTLNQE